MRWVVDASNVIGSKPDGWWRDRDGAARRLDRRTSRRSPRAAGEPVTVVLDAGPPELARAGTAASTSSCPPPRPRRRRRRDRPRCSRPPRPPARSASPPPTPTSPPACGRWAPRSEGGASTVPGAPGARWRERAHDRPAGPAHGHDRAQRARPPVARPAAAARGPRAAPATTAPSTSRGIELIRELQADGFNLELIRRLLDSTGSSAAALRFTRALRAPFADEAPEVVTTEQLAERWGTHRPEAAQARAEELGLLRPLGEDRWEELSPRLGARERRAGGAGALGAPGARGRRPPAPPRRQPSPDTFMRLFVDAVWKPFEAAGRPEERWPEVERRRWSACARWPPSRCWRCSRSPWTTRRSERSGASSSGCPELARGARR